MKKTVKRVGKIGFKLWLMYIALLAVLSGYGIYLDTDSKQYVDSIVPAILSQVDGSPSSSVLADVCPDDLGRFEEYKASNGGAVVTSRPGGMKIVADYASDVQFTNGPAVVRTRLTWNVRKGWKVEDLQVAAK